MYWQSRVDRDHPLLAGSKNAQAIPHFGLPERSVSVSSPPRRQHRRASDVTRACGNLLDTGAAINP